MAKWLKSEACLTFAVADGIGRVTLNRPDRRNALSPELIGEIQGAMLEADDRTDVSVVVLAGAGSDFCAGYDLAAIYGAGASTPAGKSALPYRSGRSFDDDAWRLEHGAQRLLSIFDMHKPVIAKVQGHCLAGGMELALLCDLVVAAEDARIGHPGTRAMGTPPLDVLVYHVGPQWAKRLLFSGDVVTGRDAARIGLVLDAFPAAELDAEVDRLAARLAMVDAEMLAVHKRAANLALELMGARTMQRLSAELDARAHVAQGPRRSQYLAEAAAHGQKEALRRRDALWGRDPIEVRNA